MDDLLGAGNSAQFRALYYLGSVMAQALTEYIDEEGTTPQATWSVTSVDLQAYGPLSERFAKEAIWGILQFTEQPGGAFILLNIDSAQALLALAPNKVFSDEQLGNLDIVLNRLTEAFSQAWADIAILEPQLGTFAEPPDIEELQEIFMGLSAATPIVCTAFRVAVPAQPLARVVLAIPQPYLIPHGQSLDAAAEMTYLNGKDDAIDDRLDHLGDVPVPIAVTLGGTTMALTELQNLEVDDLIVLEQPVGSPLACDLGGGRIWVKPGTTADGLRRAVQVVKLGTD